MSTPALHVAVVPFCAMLAACSGSDDEPYAALFDASEKGPKTPNSIYGIWSGKQTGQGADVDVRLQVTTDTLILAGRCQFTSGATATVGVSTPVVVTERTVTMQEEKEDTARVSNGSCYVRTEAGTATYEIDGVALTVNPGTPKAQSYTKVSD